MYHFPPLLAAAEAAHLGLLDSTILGLVIVGFILVIALCVLVVISGWRIYQKAGKPGWASLIPFYNMTTLLQMVNKPLWWVVLLLVPVLNIIIYLILAVRLAHVFGKGRWFGVGLLFLPFIFGPVLAFGKAEYHNMYPAPAPMSDAVKWALIAAFAGIMLQGVFSQPHRSYEREFFQKFESQTMPMHDWYFDSTQEATSSVQG
jgi:hypothetical protein